MKLLSIKELKENSYSNHLGHPETFDCVVVINYGSEEMQKIEEYPYTYVKGDIHGLGPQMDDLIATMHEKNELHIAPYVVPIFNPLHNPLTAKQFRMGLLKILKLTADEIGAQIRAVKDDVLRGVIEITFEYATQFTWNSLDDISLYDCIIPDEQQRLEFWEAASKLEP